VSNRLQPTSNGYRQLVSWLRSHGELVLVGVEGTGSYGVGGFEVSPTRRCPRGRGRPAQPPDPPPARQADPVDVAAARAALSGSATGSPKSRNGNVEAIRVLMIARRSAVDVRIETLNQLRHVVFRATPEIRAKFTGLTAIALVNKASALRPREGDDPSSRLKPQLDQKYHYVTHVGAAGNPSRLILRPWQRQEGKDSEQVNDLTVTRTSGRRPLVA